VVGPFGVEGGMIFSGVSMKLAVIFFALSMVMEVGLVLPERSPDQPLKVYPKTALAEIVSV
jgi:hypothetical protein